MFNVTGTIAAPVTGIAFKGLGFRDAAYTYFLPHGMPSGGDWGLQRHAALFLQGTQNSLVTGCVFERLDGNAVMLSAYNRFATISGNEFAWNGDTCIASWGKTYGAPGGVEEGYDATAGDYPRYNQIIGNIAREMGVWEKQSSFYFQVRLWSDHAGSSSRVRIVALGWRGFAGQDQRQQCDRQHRLQRPPCPRQLQRWPRRRQHAG